MTEIKCFYCQKLGSSSRYGKCAFCGKRDSKHASPLYPVVYQGKEKTEKWLKEN